VLQLDEGEGMGLSQRCPSCKAAIEAEFSVCPNCLTSLKILCKRCNQQLKIDWKICPYCRGPVTEEEAIPVPLLPAAGESDLRAAAGGGASTSTGSGAYAASTISPAPLDAREVPTSDAPPPEVTAPSKMPRILIVDDDPSIRTIVAKSLEQLPFAVGMELASNGLEAVDIAGRDHPDLIVLDVMMPEMDGFEVCQKLRSQVETAFIPIMMLTANPSEEGRIRGYMVGSDDYVSKPFNVAELNARVTRLLRRAYGIS
jgi:CheY-like chemotaxis protein/RNA polymerase subunit RPABC4/transcription elongation factor Spt4